MRETREKLMKSRKSNKHLKKIKNKIKHNVGWSVFTDWLSEKTLSTEFNPVSG